jgi:hypothetical protein
MHGFHCICLLLIEFCLAFGRMGDSLKPPPLEGLHCRSLIKATRNGDLLQDSFVQPSIKRIKVAWRLRVFVAGSQVI